MMRQRIGGLPRGQWGETDMAGATKRRVRRAWFVSILAIVLVVGWVVLSTCTTSRQPSKGQTPSPKWSVPSGGKSTFKELAASDDRFGSDEFQPFVFLHFGDPQIGMKWHGSVAKQIRRFADAVSQANELKPAFVVIAGDLTHQRKPKQWAAFDAELGKLEVPVMLTAGNHDMHDPEEREAYVKRHGKDYYAVTYSNCTFLVINSMLFKEPFVKEQAAADQWAFIENTLPEAEKRGRTHVFISLHHPPTSNRSDVPDRLLALARKHGVRVFLAGHTHKNRVVETKDGTPSIYVTSGTNALFRTGKGADHGYRIIRVYKDRVEQTHVHLTKTPLEEKKKHATPGSQ